MSTDVPAQGDGPTDTAQTYGWDTVFTMHIDDVNAGIVAQKSSPPGFEQVDTDEGYTIKGDFGDWAVVPGGDGDIVRMALPIRNMLVQGPNAAGAVTGTAHVEVRLDLLHDADVAARRHLKIRTTAAGGDTPIATVVGMVFPDPQPAFLTATVIHALLQDWLNTNLADFDHVFSTLDLDRRAATGAFQWMQPTDVAYAYTDLGTSNDGALAILAMTGGRSSQGLVQQVSNTCIPQGKKASLLIAKARVMQQLLLPTIPLTYKGATADGFTLSTTGESVVLGPSGVHFTLTSDGKDYEADIEPLSVSILGQELTYDVTTRTQLSPGIRAHTRTISRLNMTLGKAKDGGQALEFVDAKSADITHWTDSDPGIQIAEDVLAIAVIVASVVATVMTDGAAASTLALAIGFAAGAMTVTTEAIADAGKDAAPAIGAAILDATAAIDWPAKSRFLLDAVELNDSLQLSGAYAQ